MPLLGANADLDLRTDKKSYWPGESIQVDISLQPHGTIEIRSGVVELADETAIVLFGRTIPDGETLSANTVWRQRLRLPVPLWAQAEKDEAPAEMTWTVRASLDVAHGRDIHAELAVTIRPGASPNLRPSPVLDPVTIWGFGASDDADDEDVADGDNDTEDDDSYGVDTLVGIAVAPDGVAYVSDAEDNCLYVLAPDGTVADEWRNEDEDADPYWTIGHPAIDGNGNVLVPDAENSRVELLSPEGDILELWETSAVTAGDPFDPESVAVAPDGAMYAYDADWGQIIVLGSNGAIAGRLDAPLRGDDPNYDVYPAIVVDAQGVIYVANTDEGQIDRRTTAGEALDPWGELGCDLGQLVFPSGLALDAAGDLYVADTWNDRIQIFSPEGNVVAAWGRDGEQPGHFDSPQGVGLDGEGNVYVVDTGNDRVQKFAAADVDELRRSFSGR